MTGSRTRTRVLLASTALGLGCVDESSPCGPPPEWQCAWLRQGPCEPAVILPPECPGLEWVCPEPTVERPAPAPSRCRPTFEGRVPGTLGPLVPLGDRCGMLMDADVTAGPAELDTRVIDLSAASSLAACGLGALTDEPWVDDAGLGPADVVDVMDVEATPDGVLAVHRLFELAPQALFGVEALGASLVRADRGMPVPRPPQFNTHGYRSLAVDQSYAYVFDCFGAPDALLEDCGVMRARLDDAFDPAAYEWLRESGTYGGAGDPKVVFQAGPHHHVADLGLALRLWVMVSVAGFGDTVFLQHTWRGDPAGWAAPVDVHRCELPPDDPEAFCDSARVLTSLYDGDRHRELTLTYRVDTLAADRPARIARDPEAYGAVMVRVQVELPEDPIDGID